VVRLRWSVGWMEECRRAVGANVHDSGDHHPERRDLLLGRPPGIKKSDLQIDKRLKDVAPCIELQCWFSQDTAKWQDSWRRYLPELERNPRSWQPIIQSARQRTVTLITGA